MFKLYSKRIDSLGQMKLEMSGKLPVELVLFGINPEGLYEFLWIDSLLNASTFYSRMSLYTNILLSLVALYIRGL